MPRFSADSFTESADTALTSHTGETGATWTKNSSYTTSTVPQVVGATDRERLNDSAHEVACYASGLPAGIDYDVQVTVNVVSRDGYHGVTGRGATATLDWYEAFVDSAGSGGEGYYLGKYVSGTFTELASYVTTPQTGDILKLRVRGSSVEMLVNGTVRGSATDTSFKTAGRVGIFGAQYAAPGNSVGYHFDNFEALDAPVTINSTAAVSAGGTTSITVAYPTITAADAGKMLLCYVGNRPNANTPDDISGWIKGSATGGAGSEGAGTGTIRGTYFLKPCLGTESGTLSVTCTGGTSMFGRMFLLASQTGKMDVVAVSGSDNSAGTSWSATAGSNPGILTDDLIIAASINSEDTARAASEALSATGVTFYSGFEHQDSGITTGNDLGMIVWSQHVKSGASTAAPVYTMTMSGTNAANSAGVTWFFRVRAIPNTPDITLQSVKRGSFF